MTEVTGMGAFIYIWITFAVLATTGIVVVLVWAARNGQFGNQEHARWLALLSKIPDSEDAPSQADGQEGGMRGQGNLGHGN